MSIYSIILSAGRSERMGMLKAFLRFDEQFTFIEKLLSVYSFTDEIITVVNNEVLNDDRWSKTACINSENVKVVLNTIPELGRFHSVKLGIKNLTSKNFVHGDSCFIQNIDNPFTNRSITEALIKTNIELGYALPVCNDTGGHPVLIASDVMNFIRDSNEKDCNFRELLSVFKRTEIKVSEDKILANVNSADDYRNYFPYKI